MHSTAATNNRNNNTRVVQNGRSNTATVTRRGNLKTISTPVTNTDARQRTAATASSTNAKNTFLLHNSSKSRSAIMKEEKTAIGGQPSLFVCPMPEVEEPPLDVEEILSSRQIARSEIRPIHMPPQRLRDLLEKDVQFKTVHRANPFVEGESVQSVTGPESTPTRDLIAWFSRKPFLIEPKWTELSVNANAAKIAAQREKLAEELPKQIFEGNAEMRESPEGNASLDSFTGSTLSRSVVVRRGTVTQPQQMDGRAMELVAETIGEQKLDEWRENTRHRARGELIANLAVPELNEEDYAIELDASPLPHCWVGQRRLSIHFSHFSLDPPLEPLFATLALYDARMRQKLSEDFHLDSDGNAFGKRALFTLPENDEGDSLVLVFRMEKALTQGGVDTALEQYMAKRPQTFVKPRAEALPPHSDPLVFKKYRQMVGLVAVPVARTMASSLSGEMNQRRGAGAPPPRSFTDSFICAEASNNNAQNNKVTLQQRDSISETSSDRFSYPPAPVPPTPNRPANNNSSSWTIASQPQSDTPNWTQSARVVSVRICSFFKSEPLAEIDFFEWLSASLNAQTAQQRSREKVSVEMRFEMEVLSMGQRGLRVISPELRQLNVGNATGILRETATEEDEQRTAVDVLPFPVSTRLVSVHHFPRHLLFVYPRNVNFSARMGQNARNRNIAVRVEMRNSKMERMAVFAMEAGLREEVHSPVQYHCKQPLWIGTEWKLVLPHEGMEEGAHLHFTFLHISCKRREGTEKQQQETHIGYSWLPLGPSLPTGDQHLPISLDPLPPAICFLSPHLNVPNMRWLDSHRPLFHVSLQLVSSIQPQDPHLVTFLRLSRPLLHPYSANPPIEQLSPAIHNMLKCCPEQMLAFIHVLLHRLLVIIASQEGSAARTSFDTLCQLANIGKMLLDGKVDGRGRSRILAEFVRQERLPGEWDEEGTVDENGNVWRNPGEEQVNTNGNEQARTEQNQTTKLRSAPLFEQLVGLFATSSGHARDTASSTAWFLLSLIHRSMAEHLCLANGALLPRKLRFRPQFLASLRELGDQLGQEMCERAAKNFAQARAINLAWARFLRQCISLTSRTFVLEQLKRHCETLDQRIASDCALSSSLLTLKLAFLRVLYSHEHFLFLCLPFAELPPSDRPKADSFKNNLTTTSSRRGTTTTTTTTTTTASITSAVRSNHPTPAAGATAPVNSSNPSAPLPLLSSHAYRLRHFPIHLLLSQLRSLLAHRQSSPAAHCCVHLLHSLIAAHESDWRLKDAELGHRVAIMYSPLLGIVLEMREMLFGQREQQQHENMDNNLNNASRRDADAGLASEEEGSSSRQQQLQRNGSTTKRQQHQQMAQRLLLCICWLLRSLRPSTLLAHLRQMSPTQHSHFTGLLHSVVSTFSTASSVDTAKCRRNSTGSCVAPNACCRRQPTREFQLLPVVGRRPSVDTSASGNTLEGGSEKVKWRSGRGSEGTEAADPVPHERVIARHLSTQAVLLVLDQFELLLQLAPSSQHLLPDLFRLLLHIFAQQSNSLCSLQHAFRSQRAFTRKHADFVLGHPQLLSELCLQLLRHMTSGLAELRDEAALSTFALLRTGFRHHTKGTFANLKKTFTMALSLVAAAGATLNDANLHDALENILRIRDGNEERRKGGDKPGMAAKNFRKETEELVANLNAILSDTLKLTALGDDFEMSVDLMHRIANGYRQNPELRLAWLMAIARRHLGEDGTATAMQHNHAEAAQCLLHCCAIVASSSPPVLVDVDGEQLLPHSVFDAFEELSDNVREEWATTGGGGAKAEAAQPQLPGGKLFSADGYAEMVERMARLFERAQLFELVPSAFRTVLPLYERQHAHSKMIQAHAHIVSCLSRLDPPHVMVEAAEAVKGKAPHFVELHCADKRCFGTYFRVRFFGPLFGELDGAEFVYKEPSITKLAEISHRLEEFYSARFGPANVEVLKESNDIETGSLDPEKAHLQITYVEPHFDRWERRRRQTHVQRNYRIRHFVFATPFTHSGKAHGPLHEQCKRKTVLTVEKSFPYVKTRLRVIRREQSVLSPIEVAIEDMQKRIWELGAVMHREPKDPKMLQMVLQGCIGTTVNQGPLEIARVFLAQASLDSEGLPKEPLQRKLRACFDDMCKRCSEAMEANERLMEPGREEYQRELRRNMAHFEQSLATMFNDPVVAPSSPATPSPAELVQALAMAGRIGPISSV